jgi:PAS domain S-box-containing protein
VKRTSSSSNSGDVSAADSPGRGAPEAVGPPSVRGLWALGFVAFSLVALVAVPVYFGQRVAVLQERITDVLEPAARLSSNLGLLKARQFARMEGFLATEDARAFQDPYNAAATEEDSVLAELQVLMPALDAVPTRLGGPTFFERLARLQTESLDWRFDNQRVFEVGVREGTRARVLSGYQDLQRVTRDLDQAIQAEVVEGRRQVANERRLQSRITLALAMVALFANLIVARVAYRYRALTTEREVRRREAVRARREVDALLEATGDGVLGIDLGGTCVSLNRAGARLVGFSESEIQGRDAHAALFHTGSDGEPALRETSDLVAAIASGRALTSPPDAIIWNRRGESFPTRWSLQPMIDGTELRGAVLTFTDMSEIQEKEEALRKAIRQREDVVSIVSHDLRNPLGVTLAAADLLLDLPLDDGQRRRQAEIIRRSGKRMQRLIDDLLDVARMEAGALVVRPSSEPLIPILNEAQELFRHQAEEKGLRLDVTSGNGDPVARVDRDRIIQALSNLLDNAIRLTPPGGSVTMTAEDDGRDVLVSVADTGPGIALELVGGLFDRFAQGQEPDRGAVGLGLSIVNGVAVAHGGEASVLSVPGEGSLFTLRLPKEGPAPDMTGRTDNKTA